MVSQHQTTLIKIMKISNITTSSSYLTMFLFSLVGFSSAVDTISTAQLIRDGDTIVSSKHIFELGFFSPGSSKHRYLGVWYKNISTRTVVWVANRESPLRNTTSGALTISRSGNLVILDERSNNTVWSTNASGAAANPVVQLLDSGNLVIREANAKDYYLWQSFDFPTDTLIPGMYYGWNLVTGRQIYLSSWRTKEDPATGDFTSNIDIIGYPQAVIKRGDALQFRLGPFNGVRFSGMPNPKPNSTSPATFIMNSSVVLYKWAFDINCPVFMRFTLSPSGVEQVLMWVDRKKDWVVYYSSPLDQCDNYATCGAHGRCNNENFPPCGCLKRFVPREPVSWARSEWSGGCVRRTPLNCRDDVFLKYSGFKIPDTRFSSYNISSNLKDCEAMCSRNCSCTAYSNVDVRNGGSGCLLWFGDLLDIKAVTGEDQEIYIRMAASELGSKAMERRKLIFILTSLAGFLLLGLSLPLFIKKMKKDRKLRKKEALEECNDQDFELPMYDLATVAKATNCFSRSNKLGEGGFGLVYKGMLDDGKEIAVKRLSKTSSQGLEEFKNEVICIAKLQHRNLVKLLGWCIEGEEKMLIYEYMPNNSLDITLFDEAEKKQLDWLQRRRIINGIARGLLYLHQDSCLRIIHRDLKASNVLLDNDLNPKISDFGMARIFGGNETEGNTRRVVGTYGYMSPEYVVDGFFSLKSDVYSFGVLVLEIVSGHRNRGFHHKDHYHNLVGHAWILYKEGRSRELIDRSIGNTDDLLEVLRTIHVALLCVQQRPQGRPDMSSVVVMLGSGCVLPEAKEPGFFTERQDIVSSSSNEYTLTQIEAR